MSVRLTPPRSLPPVDSPARWLIELLHAHRSGPIPGVDVGTAYSAVDDGTRVGGDVIDVYQFNNASMAICVAEISGRDPQVSARAALVKYGLRAYVSSGLTAEQVLRNMNVLFTETSKFEKENPAPTVSVFLGIIDAEHNVMTYASAGHEPVMLLRPGRLPELLPTTGPVIGPDPDPQKVFHQRLVNLEPGGTALIVTTDGVTQACCSDGRVIQRADMMRWIEQSRDLPAQEQADALLMATHEFCEGKPNDDIAIVAARFL